jgi:hypothetical protein
MKKLMFALALVGFVASANAGTFGDDKKKCDKDKKACCAKKDGAKACAGKEEAKSCHGKSETKAEEKKQ